MDALLHAEVMAMAATEIAWSTPALVTSRHPLGNGMPGSALRGVIWSPLELHRPKTGRAAYLTSTTEIPTANRDPKLAGPLHQRYGVEEKSLP